MDNTYIIITFPEIQFLMEKPGFRENACLANDKHFVDEYGSSAYFVEQSWLNKNK